MSDTIDALARRIGELRAAEVAVFEALGAWALDPTADAEDRVTFAACAHRAAWRADQLTTRAPVLAALPPDAAIALGADELGRAASALATAPPTDRIGVARSIGALLEGAYGAALDAVAPTDAPSRRLFQRLTHDVTLTD